MRGGETAVAEHGFGFGIGRPAQTRIHVDRAAIGRRAEISGIAGPALHVHLADFDRGKIGDRVMRRAVSVAERDAIPSLIELAVRKPAQRILDAAVGKTGAIHVAAGDRRCNRQQPDIVGGGRRRILNISAVNDGLRLGRIDRSFVAGARVGLNKVPVMTMVSVTASSAAWAPPAKATRACSQSRHRRAIHIKGFVQNFGCFRHDFPTLADAPRLFRQCSGKTHPVGCARDGLSCSIGPHRSATDSRFRGAIFRPTMTFFYLIFYASMTPYVAG